MRLFFTYLFLVFIYLNNIAQTITTSVIKPPAQLGCNDVPVKLNNVVFGAIPPNSADKPVIIYVHGWFDNGYSWFMANNKWYEESYNAGYRTAYFFHHYSDAFVRNGKVIAEMIRKTCLHYNTKNIVALCHSKGGLDLEWALYNENVWDSIAGVVTLSSPYHGAPLIDLISNPFIKPILQIIPIVGPIFQGAGTYQMQPAYMKSVVRPMMDNHPNNKPQKFHCFGAWGGSHITVLPPTIPDNILKIIFPDYNPLCINLPGFGTILGGLMSAGMAITESLTRLIPVQPQYNNPQKNTFDNDGLVPYYSAFRPGSVIISQPKPSISSFKNHIDELFSWYFWDIVKPEFEYFKNNPVYRTMPTVNAPIDESVEYHPISDYQFVQSNEFEFTNDINNKLIVVGEYKNVTVKILNVNDEVIKTIPVNFSIQGMFDIFHEIDLTGLSQNEKYKIQSSEPLTSFYKDGNAATLELNINTDRTYYVNDNLGFEAKLNNWTEPITSTEIVGYLNRNLDEQGEVVNEKNIEITFTYDALKDVFIGNNQMKLENGIYNLSVFANGQSLKRFATTSVAINQENKKNILKDEALIVYPNPTSSILNVRLNTTESNKYQLKIVDISGKEVFNKNIENNAKEIQLNTTSLNLSDGTYVISIYSNGIKQQSKSFVVNK